MSTQFITLDSAPYICFAGSEPAEPAKIVFTPTGDDAIRARLADTARQEENRRRLREILRKPTPAWNPDDHPDIEAAGGAAAWVRKLRSEAELGFRRRAGIDEKE
jgi:hypothetical protein